MFIATALWGAGYWLTQRLSAQSQELAQTLIQVAQAGDMARKAQNDFKTQVQEWKNILIRGHDPDQMTKYQEGFNKSEKEVEADLAALKALLQALEVSTEAVDKTTQELRTLGAKYRESLATWKARDALAYRAWMTNSKAWIAP